MTFDSQYITVFGAGTLSFLSPCVLPLVPFYLVFISGVSLDDLKRGNVGQNKTVLITALAFVLGFSTVFVASGATASYVGQLLREPVILYGWQTTPYEIMAKLGAVAIIVMGLNFLGVFKLSFLSQEKRYHQEAKPVGFLGAYVVGLAFAFGWTPCLGPVLGVVEGLAASSDSVGKGATLLGVYSLGLGIPFLIAAAAINSFLGFFARFRQKLGLVEKLMGGLLVVAGLMFLTGGMQSISYWLLEHVSALQNIG